MKNRTKEQCYKRWDNHLSQNSSSGYLQHDVAMGDNFSESDDDDDLAPMDGSLELIDARPQKRKIEPNEFRAIKKTTTGFPEDEIKPKGYNHRWSEEVRIFFWC
jgi:hypothetical protein